MTCTWKRKFDLFLKLTTPKSLLGIEGGKAAFLPSIIGDGAVDVCNTTSFNLVPKRRIKDDWATLVRNLEACRRNEPWTAWATCISQEKTSWRKIAWEVLSRFGKKKTNRKRRATSESYRARWIEIRSYLTQMTPSYVRWCFARGVSERAQLDRLAQKRGSALCSAHLP